MFIGRIDLLKSLTKQSNLFLHLGKVRVGLKVRMGFKVRTGLKVRMGYPQRKGRLWSGGGGDGGGWHGEPWRY